MHSKHYLNNRCVEKHSGVDFGICNDGVQSIQRRRAPSTWNAHLDVEETSRNIDAILGYPTRIAPGPLVVHAVRTPRRGRPDGFLAHILVHSPYHRLTRRGDDSVHRPRRLWLSLTAPAPHMPDVLRARRPPVPRPCPARRAQAERGSSSSPEPPEKSDVVVIGEELVLIVVDALEVREVDLVPQQAADAAKALDELRALLRAVRDELEVRAELLVLLGEPLEKRLWVDDLLHLEPGGLVEEPVALFFLLLVRVDDDLLCTSATWLGQNAC